MLTYMYQAALYCEDCGRKIRAELDAAGKAPADPSDEHTYDSDDYPKGPFDAGEADTPHHCDACDLFLENDLTNEGIEDLWRMVCESLSGEREQISDRILEWSEFYDLDVCERLRELKGKAAE